MAQIDVVNLKNEKVGTVELLDSVFNQKVNQPLVLQVIKAQLAGLRQGTAATKTKGLIRGGGKKPFRQKGTGNARQGSSRSPLMPGGGATFGPQPRKYNQDTPKKMVQGALRCVLSDKLQAKHLVVIDQFNVDLKTKNINALLADVFKVKKALFIDKQNQNLELASRNLPTAKYLREDRLNTYDVVKYDWLFISKESVKSISERLELVKE